MATPTPSSNSSTVTASSTSSQPILTPSQLLEINLISAQDLASVSKSMRSYALTWVNPNRKLSTSTDQRGHNNPTWNHKFAFPIDDDSLDSDNAAVNVEIYTVSWFRDVLIGTVSVLISDLITPSERTQPNSKNIRFVTLQVRRPSGSPQGILNMGVRLLDSTMRSMPLLALINPPGDHEEHCGETAEKTNDNPEEQKQEEESKEQILLWRSLSLGSEVLNGEFPHQSGSVCNGSMVNGSELCSDIGPSASIVAAQLAMKSHPRRAPPPPWVLQKPTEDGDTGSSILEELTVEEARAKGYMSSRERWRKENSLEDEANGDDPELKDKLSRRNSEGDLFSCFGNAYGIQVKIVCGANNGAGNNNYKKLNNSKSKRNKSSEANSAQPN